MTEYYPGFIQDATGAWVTHPQAYQPIPGTTAGVDTGVIVSPAPAPTVLQGGVSYTPPAPTYTPITPTGATGAFPGGLAQQPSILTPMTPTYGTSNTPTLTGGVQTTQVPLNTELGQYNPPGYISPLPQSPPVMYQAQPYYPNNPNGLPPTPIPNGGLGTGGVYGTNNSMNGTNQNVGQPSLYMQQPSTTTIMTNPGAIGAFNPAMYPNGITGYQSGDLAAAAAQAAAIQSTVPDARFLPGGMYYGQNPASTGQPMTQSIAVAINQNPTAYAPEVVQQVNGTTQLQGGVTNNYYQVPVQQQLTPEQQRIQLAQQGLMAALSAPPAQRPPIPGLNSLPTSLQNIGQVPGASQFGGSNVQPNAVAQQQSGYSQFPQVMSDANTPMPSDIANNGNINITPAQASYGYPMATEPGQAGYQPNNPYNKMARSMNENYMRMEGMVEGPRQRMQAVPPAPRKGFGGLMDRIHTASQGPGQRNNITQQNIAVMQAVAKYNKDLEDRRFDAMKELRQYDDLRARIQSHGDTINAQQQQRNDLTDNDIRGEGDAIAKQFPYAGPEQDAALRNAQDRLNAQGFRRNGMPVNLSSFRGNYPAYQAELRAKEDMHKAREQTLRFQLASYDDKIRQIQNKTRLMEKQVANADWMYQAKKDLTAQRQQLNAQQMQMNQQSLALDPLRRRALEDAHKKSLMGLAKQEQATLNQLRVASGQTIGSYLNTLNQLSLDPEYAGTEPEKIQKRNDKIKSLFGAVDEQGTPKSVVDAYSFVSQEFPQELPKLEQSMKQSIMAINATGAATVNEQSMAAQARGELGQQAPKPMTAPMQSGMAETAALRSAVIQKFGMTPEKLRQSQNPVHQQAVQRYDAAMKAITESRAVPVQNLAPMAASEIDKVQYFGDKAVEYVGGKPRPYSGAPISGSSGSDTLPVPPPIVPPLVRRKKDERRK